MNLSRSTQPYTTNNTTIAQIVTMLRHEGPETFLEEGEAPVNLGKFGAAWRNYYYGETYMAKTVIGEDPCMIVWIPSAKQALVTIRNLTKIVDVKEADKYDWTVQIHASRIEITELYHNIDPVQLLPVVVRGGAYEVCITSGGYSIRCPYQTDAIQVTKGVGNMCRDVFRKLGMKLYEYAPGKESWRPNGKINTEARSVEMTWERNPKKSKEKRKSKESDEELEEDMPEVTKKRSKSKGAKAKPVEKPAGKKRLRKNSETERKDPHDYIHGSPPSIPPPAEKPSPPQSNNTPPVRHVAIKSKPRITEVLEIENNRIEISKHPIPAARAHSGDSDLDYIESETESTP